jgi:twitching motility protein PilJ
MSLLDDMLDDIKKGGRGRPASGPGTSGSVDIDLGPEDRFERTVGAASLRAREPGADDDRRAAMSVVAGPPSSIITEAAPSEIGGFSETRVEVPSESRLPEPAGLPVIGRLPMDLQQRVLAALVVLGLLGFVLAAAATLIGANRGGVQTAAVGQALMQSQRLAKLVSQAMQGNAASFPEVKASAEVLSQTVRDLRTGEGVVPALPAGDRDVLEPVVPLVERTERNTGTILAQQEALTRSSAAVRSINARSGALLETAESLAASKFDQQANAAELNAVGQLVMLTQRIGKSATEFLSVEGVSPESAFLLGRDVEVFRDIAQGLSAGNAELRLPGARDAATRERIGALVQQFEGTRTDTQAILGNVRGLAAAREAQSSLLADSEPLRLALEGVQIRLRATTAVSPANWGVMALSALAVLVGGWGFLRLYVRDQQQRAALAEAQRLEAEGEQLEAKRVNDANQAAILRLMNELQTVAEGDLTQQATVTEDITGAIADSVNYTVEELRSLVAQVQGVATRVAETTQQVEANSTELLAASTEQLREIRDTGESVLQMAGRINAVSAQAQETAQVARQSRQAAESGLRAVQDTIGGMNAIRDQIQETSKRIKRLGESSQEIGEITELISDITEQTNVLALNAAIQAASAGEAGRGFSVVAEEVQRLAERSADATRQIAALVKAIQTDTQDAVAAMERSTQGVVEGAQLSDNAGAALADIDRVSRRLADLIAQISREATAEANSANVVAANIQHIFAVTEQTEEGTRSTAQMVRELSRTAEELRQSVERFKIA